MAGAKFEFEHWKKIQRTELILVNIIDFIPK